MSLSILRCHDIIGSVQRNICFSWSLISWILHVSPGYFRPSHQSEKSKCSYPAKLAATNHIGLLECERQTPDGQTAFLWALYQIDMWEEYNRFIKRSRSGSSYICCLTTAVSAAWFSVWICTNCPKPTPVLPGGCGPSNFSLSSCVRCCFWGVMSSSFPIFSFLTACDTRGYHEDIIISLCTKHMQVHIRQPRSGKLDST